MSTQRRRSTLPKMSDQEAPGTPPRRKSATRRPSYGFAMDHHVTVRRPSKRFSIFNNLLRTNREHLDELEEVESNDLFYDLSSVNKTDYSTSASRTASFVSFDSVSS